jgi:hypothetical protein
LDGARAHSRGKEWAALRSQLHWQWPGPNRPGADALLPGARGPPTRSTMGRPRHSRLGSAGFTRGTQTNHPDEAEPRLGGGHAPAQGKTKKEKKKNRRRRPKAKNTQRRRPKPKTQAPQTSKHTQDQDTTTRHSKHHARTSTLPNTHTPDLQLQPLPLQPQRLAKRLATSVHGARQLIPLHAPHSPPRQAHG